MERRNIVAPAILAAILLGGASISGCVSTSTGQGIEAIETMTDADYQRFVLYLQLGIKISANRALAEELVTVEDLELAAEALVLIRDGSVVSVAGEGLIAAGLTEVGLTNDEIFLLLEILELELQQRGGLDLTDPVTGQIMLTSRTEDLLTIIADTLLESTQPVTEQEIEEGMTLQEEFNGQLIRE
jgi:hypothetical protein